ncbi:MAG: 4Fe-4S dicluster domain-containing protein [Planctomycetota bacterium]|jgi:ferredoxin
MSIVFTAFWIMGIAAGLFFFFFFLSAIAEKKQVAAWLSAGMLIGLIGIWLAAYRLFHSVPFLLTVPAVIIVVLALLFFLPWKKGTPMVIGDVTEQVDERDIMFSREEYLPGSDRYETYYKMRPDLRDIDDELRGLPPLLGEGGRFHDPEGARDVGTIFSVIEGMLTKVDGETSPDRIDVDPKKITADLKDMALALGADEVGAAALNPAFVYSHVGRGPESWGAPIENNHEFALMFTLEMRYFPVEGAPTLAITRETALQYLRGALISIALARFIRSLGYPARAHIAGSNYQIMLPPVAHDAGLGELGRIGYLISRKYGARVRLGGITTALPLQPDTPVVFGVQDFCDTCLKCARNCPSGAIPRGPKIRVSGAEKWQLDIEKCFHFWRSAGSDCGLCMKVCPYSHPPTLVHNLVRAGIERSSFARTISLWGDDLFYGKKTHWEG